MFDEHGARPVRAMTDFGEALIEVRRGTAGNRERALALLNAARGPFEEIGMAGVAATGGGVEAAVGSLSLHPPILRATQRVAPTRAAAW